MNNAGTFGDHVQERVYDLLSEKGTAFCIYDFDRRRSPKVVTAEFVYIRLHRPEGLYKGKYDSRSIAGWAGAMSNWVRKDKEVYYYFDNVQSGYAAQDVFNLNRMIGKE